MASSQQETANAGSDAGDSWSQAGSGTKRRHSSPGRSRSPARRDRGGRGSNRGSNRGSRRGSRRDSRSGSGQDSKGDSKNDSGPSGLGHGDRGRDDGRRRGRGSRRRGGSGRGGGSSQGRGRATQSIVPGMQGIWITATRTKERTCKGHMIDEFLDLIELHLDVYKTSNDTADNKTSDESGNKNVANYASGVASGNDVTDGAHDGAHDGAQDGAHDDAVPAPSNSVSSHRQQLEQEKEELKHPKKLITPVHTGVNCIIFLKVDDSIDVVRLVKLMFEDMRKYKHKPSPWVQRVLPIERICPASLEDIEENAEVVLKPHLKSDNSNTKFAVRTSFCSHNKLQRLDIISKAVKPIGENHKTDLTDPDKLIVAIMYKNVAALSVIEKFKCFAQYNVANYYDSLLKEASESTASGAVTGQQDPSKDLKTDAPGTAASTGKETAPADVPADIPVYVATTASGS